MTARQVRSAPCKAWLLLRSLGNALAPAMTLNRMYRWVPRIISGDSQMRGRAYSGNNGGKKRKEHVGRERGQKLGDGLHGFGNLAGLSPIHARIGTQMRLVSAMRMMTRSIVSRPAPTASMTSFKPSVACT